MSTRVTDASPTEAPRPAPPKPQHQKSLPFARAWQITVRSIKIRLARSVITAAGIVLGIAFYSSVRAAGLFGTGGTSVEAIAAGHRQQWLAYMALLVCFVGIMNSMLMSVTERFKEIGTMKCLGALDSDVVKLFFIEACVMGLTSSVLGWFLGWFLIVLIHIFTGGFHAGFVPQSIMQMVVSVGIGTSITLLAAVPPARHTAKMPPAVALRSEV